MGQLAESLIRLVRTIVGIRLHTEDLSVEQGVRMFREDAFLEEVAARREAERVIPENLLSFMGESRRLSNQRIKRELRFRLRYPSVMEGIAAKSAKS